MMKDYEKLFTYLNKPRPSDELFQKIMSGIHEKSNKSVLIKKITIFSVSLIGSLSALISALILLGARFSESGFYQYISLMFSDFRIIASNWQDYAISLLQALPAFSIALVLISALWLISSAGYLVKNVRFLKTAY
jgi:hypothetical protein